LIKIYLKNLYFFNSKLNDRKLGFNTPLRVWVKCNIGLHITDANFSRIHLINKLCVF